MKNQMEIIVYSKNNCVFCNKAKQMLKNLGLDYKEKKMEDFESVESMLEDIGKKVRTMPQIKIDGKLVGGYNQLVEYFADQGKVNFKGEIISE
jgi:glutaredoxin